MVGNRSGLGNSESEGNDGIGDGKEREEEKRSSKSDHEDMGRNVLTR